MANEIVRLMSVPEENRGLSWLQESLANAVQLELSTLPPYLTAYWSIISPANDTAATLILDILLEEMYHMGQVANLLTGVGGTPVINSQVPTYPGPLPGGVRPQLTVYLAGLSRPWLNDVAMQIEYPEGGPIALFKGVSYPTIGAFYEAIQAATAVLKPAFDTSKQLTQTIKQSGGSNTVTPVATPADAIKAIEVVKVQGEGTHLTPAGGGGELAHYYEFAEIYHGATLVYDSGTGQWSYTGAAIPFPATYDVPPVPLGGFPDATGDALANLEAFNAAYTSLLNSLQQAWATTDANALSDAINTMYDLQTPAVNLMQIPLPSGNGNYAPTWIYGQGPKVSS